MPPCLALSSVPHLQGVKEHRSARPGSASTDRARNKKTITHHFPLRRFCALLPPSSHYYFAPSPSFLSTSTPTVISKHSFILDFVVNASVTRHPFTRVFAVLASPQPPAWIPRAARPGTWRAWRRHAPAAQGPPDARASADGGRDVYFFRNPEQLRAFAEVVLPERRARASSGRHPQVQAPVRILSAGCASGEEAYSLAVIASEQLGGADGGVAITAVDVNPGALERAAAGHYSAWSLRETPDDVRQRWFKKAGRDYVVAPSIRAAVQFEERNLAAPGGRPLAPRVVRRHLLPERPHVPDARHGARRGGPHEASPHARRVPISSATPTLFASSRRSSSSRNTHATFYYQQAGAGAGRPSAAPEVNMRLQLDARPRSGPGGSRLAAQAATPAPTHLSGGIRGRAVRCARGH